MNQYSIFVTSTCLSVILIDSVFKINKNHHSQVFLEECKYIIKEKKINKCISNDLENSSDEFDI